MRRNVSQISKNSYLKFNNLLERNAKLRTRLTRIRIANYSRETIIKKLTEMGYSRETLYPNIDNIAEKIKNEVVYSKERDKGVRSQLYTNNEYVGG